MFLYNNVYFFFFLLQLNKKNAPIYQPQKRQVLALVDISIG